MKLVLEVEYGLVVRRLAMISRIGSIRRSLAIEIRPQLSLEGPRAEEKTFSKKPLIHRVNERPRYNFVARGAALC